MNMNLIKWLLVAALVALVVRRLAARPTTEAIAAPTDDKGTMLPPDVDQSYFPGGASEFSGAPIREWWDPRGWVGL